MHEGNNGAVELNTDNDKVELDEIKIEANEDKTPNWYDWIYNKFNSFNQL